MVSLDKIPLSATSNTTLYDYKLLRMLHYLKKIAKITECQIDLRLQRDRGTLKHTSQGDYACNTHFNVLHIKLQVKLAWSITYYL